MQQNNRNAGIQDLGEGLILRQGQPDDLEALVAFHQKIQDEGEWTRILADGTHPSTGIDDFTIVEDTRKKAIVSSMCMIPQEWFYRDVGFGVARLEMVSTDPDYRWRGLVRLQFDYLHKRSAGMGHLVQVVVGRPWVYRKFGYTMALRYWDRLQVSLHVVPGLSGDQEEPYRVRPAREADIPFCASVFEGRRDRFLVTCTWDADMLHHFIFRRKYDHPLQLRVIETVNGEPAGAILHAPGLDDGLLTVILCEIIPEASWVGAAPSILRYFKSAGERYAVEEGIFLEGFNLGLGSDHPLKAFLSGYMQHMPPLAPLAWYVRVGDIPAFLRRIGPVLEQRLASSPMAGY
ncbi:MAG: GNAT family N-acetyltransferase, partial [Omnitrophica WOR_2 bacterium]